MTSLLRGQNEGSEMVARVAALVSALYGVPLVGSPYVPEGEMVKIADRIVFHQRNSIRARRRYPHGRRNGRRRWKVRVVLYRPDYDRLLAAVQSEREDGVSHGR